MRAKLWTCWTWFRERPRTRSWAWDGVLVEAQNKDKFVGLGRGTRQSSRHLSCLLSRIYRTGCDGRDDCGRPRSNAVDRATQVTQRKESWPEDWLSKQGVLARSIGRASRESQSDSLVEQWTSQDRMRLQTSKRMLRTIPFLSKWKENLLRFHSKEYDILGQNKKK